MTVSSSDHALARTVLQLLSFLESLDCNRSEELATCIKICIGYADADFILESELPDGGACYQDQAHCWLLQYCHRCPD